MWLVGLGSIPARALQLTVPCRFGIRYLLSSDRIFYTSSIKKYYRISPSKKQTFFGMVILKGFDILNVKSSLQLYFVFKNYNLEIYITAHFCGFIIVNISKKLIKKKVGC